MKSGPTFHSASHLLGFTHGMHQYLQQKYQMQIWNENALILPAISAALAVLGEKSVLYTLAPGQKLAGSKMGVSKNLGPD